MSDDQQSQVNAEVEEKGHYGQAKKDMETVHSYFEESSQQVDQNKLHKVLATVLGALESSSIYNHPTDT